MENMTVRLTAGRTGYKLTLIAAVIGLAALGGCREEEENRALKTQKGVYEGPSDTALTPEQQRSLRQRGMNQRFQ